MIAPTAATGPTSAARPGGALLELVVAIPLLALLATVAVTLLLNAQRAAQRADQTLAVSHELRHASAVLANALRPLTPHDLLAWTDTSIEFESTIATGIACNGRGARDRVDLIAAASVDVARAHESMPIQPNDQLVVFASTLDSTLAPVRLSATVHSRAPSTACAGSPLVDSSPDPGARTITVRLTDSIPRPITAGSPVRITRTVRYLLYQSGTFHFLGRRERNALGWDVTQPVAGPLLSATARGVRVVVRSAAGTPLLSGDTTAALVHVELRATARLTPRKASAAIARVDSTILDVALRATPRP